jgi:hypothetical protein
MVVGITRRVALGTGVGFFALGFVPELSFARGSSAAAGVQHQPELFAFRSPANGNLVFAVVGSVVDTSSGMPSRTKFDVRIHTGRKSWMVKGLRSLRTGALSHLHDSRLFAGEVVGPCTDAGIRYHAVVLESPPDFGRAAEKLAVWAELRSEDGWRFRVGNPFVAALLARDPALSNAYHTASPSEDRALFTEAVAKRIAVMAAADGNVANPHAHARRLAARVLPDVIEFCPDLPVGFNFASQNGRHPADNAGAVAVTVLTGAVASPVIATPFGLTTKFPYFSQPTFAA